MTPQEIFTKSVTFIMQQGRKSATSLGCLYAGPKGRACAVGCLLDRDLGAQMDQQAVSDIDWIVQAVHNEEVDLDLPAWVPEQVALLGRLQLAHDQAASCDFREQFWQSATVIAHDFGLTMPPRPGAGLVEVNEHEKETE